MADEKSVSEKLDAFLDSFTKRMDAEAEERKADRARLDAVCAKMDSYEEERKADKARADAEKMAADKARKDAEEKEKEEKAKADAEEKAKQDKEHADAARVDAATKTAQENAELRAKISALETHLMQPDTERAQFVAAFDRAEKVAQAFGDSAGAPRWTPGETRDQYRRRLLNKFKQHSPAWKDVDISPFSDKALDPVEAQIYADAARAATAPASIQPGTLRISERTDETGRKIREFHGDPEATWAPFKAPVRVVTGWTSKFH